VNATLVSVPSCVRRLVFVSGAVLYRSKEQLVRDALVLVRMGSCVAKGQKSVRLWYQYCISSSECWRDSYRYSQDL